MRVWALAVVLMGMGMTSLPAPVCGLRMERGDGVLGYAMWFVGDSKPYGWVRSDQVVMDPIGAFIIAIHEEMHVVQLQAGATSYLEAEDARLMRGKDGWLEMEAEAYCASARAAVYVGREKTLGDAVKGQARRLMSPYYGFKLTADEAEAEIWEYCR